MFEILQMLSKPKYIILIYSQHGTEEPERVEQQRRERLQQRRRRGSGGHRRETPELSSSRLSLETSNEVVTHWKKVRFP